VIKNKGIDTIDSYPHLGDGKCHFNRSGVGATISSYKNIKSGSETDLTSAIALGVVSIVVDAS
jgi:cathepsin L